MPASRSPAIAHRLHGRAARELQCGHEAKEHAGQEGDEHREGEHARVDGDLVDPWQIRRQQGAEQIQQHGSHPEPRRASQDAEQQAFREQLPDQSAPSCANGLAQRDLPPARRGAGEQQVADISRGDQQDERHGPHQHEQARAHVACEVLVEGTDGDRDVLVRSWVRVPRARHDRLELRGRRTRGNATMEAGDHLKEVLRSRLPQLRREPGRDPELRVPVGKAERQRHHTDDHRCTVVDQNRASNHLPVAAEHPLPRAVAEDDDRSCAGLVVPCGQRAPEQGAGLQHLEDAAHAADARQPHRLALPREAHVRPAVRGHDAEGRAPTAPVVEVAGRHCAAGVLAIQCLVPERVEPLGLVVRQGSEEHAVDDAEDSGVRADAQRQRQDRDGCKACVPAQGPQPVTDVLQQRAHVSLRHAGERRPRVVPARTRSNIRARSTACGTTVSGPKSAGGGGQASGGGTDRAGIEHLKETGWRDVAQRVARDRGA